MFLKGLARLSEIVMFPNEMRSVEMPFHIKFSKLNEYLAEKLKSIWGGNTKEGLIERLKKMTIRLNGGIELG